MKNPSMLPLLSSPFSLFSFPRFFSLGFTLIAINNLYICILVLRRTDRAMHVRTSQSRGDLYHHSWLNPEAPGHMTSMRLVASCSVEIHRLQRPSIRAGSHPPSPDSVCVCRREPEDPEKATPSIRRRATQAQNFRGSPPPAPRPRHDTTSAQHLYLFEHRSRGYHPGLEKAPERNE